MQSTRVAFAAEPINMGKGISMEEAVKITKKMSEEGTFLVEKPTPIEFLADVLSKLNGKFNEAVKGNDFTTIIKYSEAMTAVAKAITDLQSSKAALDKTENMIAEMLEMLKN